MIIYKITNCENGKIYIGQTKRGLEKRWMQHVAPSNANKCSALGQAIQKYGKNCFVVEPIEFCYSQEELNEREIYWISVFKSNEKEFGYNLTSGGKCCIVSDEARKKMSESHKGVKLSPEHLAARVAGQTGQKRKKEFVDWLSAERRKNNYIGDNESYYKGVTKNKRYGSKWIANINLGKNDSGEKNILFLGTFDDEELAAKTYDIAALKYFSEDETYLNFRELAFFHKAVEIDHYRIIEEPTSKYNGVFFNSHHQKWFAKSQINNQIIHLGLWENEIDAAKSYDCFVLKNNLERNLNLPEFLDYYKSINFEFYKKLGKKYGYFGVHKSGNIKKKPWKAESSVKDKTRYIGTFETIEEAAQAYDLFVIKNNLNRQLNFPELKEEYLKELCLTQQNF